MAQFCVAEASKYPNLEQKYRDLGELFEKKLWHQLTELLLEFVFNNDNFQNQNMIHLYENFVSKFEDSMNQTSFARIVCRISKQYQNLMDTMHFLESISNKRDRLGDCAWLIIQLEIAHIHLIGKLNSQCREIIENTKDMLDKNTYPDTALYAQYYKVSLQYYKVIGNADSYLDSALKFLEHTMQQDIENEKKSSNDNDNDNNNNDNNKNRSKHILISEYNLPLKEKLILASDICLAAILSRKCYNFSPLLEHKLIHCLQNTNEYDWLWKIISIFNDGNMNEWKEYTQKNAAFLRKQESVKSQLAFLEQKVRLMALVELVFQTNSHERIISFAKIADICELEIDEVELVLMRAFSLDLIKGTIDEIEQTVNITFVVARTLNNKQINELQSKTNLWCNNVSDMMKQYETLLKEKVELI